MYVCVCMHRCTCMVVLACQIVLVFITCTCSGNASGRVHCVSWMLCLREYMYVCFCLHLCRCAYVFLFFLCVTHVCSDVQIHIYVINNTIHVYIWIHVPYLLTYAYHTQILSQEMFLLATKSKKRPRLFKLLSDATWLPPPYTDLKPFQQ